MVSIQVLATPMSGLRRSASVNPIALNMARAGARSRPSVMPRLRCFRSMAKAYNRGCGGGIVGEDEPRSQAALGMTLLRVKNGNLRIGYARRSMSNCRFPNDMTLTQGASCVLTLARSEIWNQARAARADCCATVCEVGGCGAHAAVSWSRKVGLERTPA